MGVVSVWLQGGTTYGNKEGGADGHAGYHMWRQGGEVGMLCTTYGDKGAADGNAVYHIWRQEEGGVGMLCTTYGGRQEE